MEAIYVHLAPSCALQGGSSKNRRWGKRCSWKKVLSSSVWLSWTGHTRQRGSLCTSWTMIRVDEKELKISEGLKLGDGEANISDVSCCLNSPDSKDSDSNMFQRLQSLRFWMLLHRESLDDCYTMLHRCKSLICQVSLLKILAGHGDSVGRPSHDQWVVPPTKTLRYNQDEVQHVNCKMLSMKRTSIPTNKVCGSASSRHRSLSRWKAKSIWLLLAVKTIQYLLHVDSHQTAARLPHLFHHVRVIWFAPDFHALFHRLWAQHQSFLVAHKTMPYGSSKTWLPFASWSIVDSVMNTVCNPGTSSADPHLQKEETPIPTAPHFFKHLKKHHIWHDHDSRTISLPYVHYDYIYIDIYIYYISSVDSTKQKRSSFSSLKKQLFATKATPHWDQCDSLQRSSSPGRYSFGKVWELRAPPRHCHMIEIDGIWREIHEGMIFILNG